MFKSTFSKYMLAFVAIILVSFVVLSGIITSMIRNYATEEKENQLASTSAAIAYHMESSGVEQMENYISSGVATDIIAPLIIVDRDINILVVSPEKEILLSTLGVAPDESGVRNPIISESVGRVDISGLFKNDEISDGISALIHRGDLGGLLSERSIACAEDIVTMGELRGYVVSIYSTVAEDNFIKTTRQAVIISCLWVMLAAVIAVYFITERIIRPLQQPLLLQ